MVRDYEFWDQKNGFYGFDKYAEAPTPSTKKVQKILQSFIDKGYRFSLECNDCYIYPITKKVEMLKLSQSIDCDTWINIYKDKEYIGGIAFQPRHNEEECISDYSLKLEEILGNKIQ
tara:strand:- start:964 stop:1314 length:351 start_codon:yes stop_codon:yes gene_type:complete